jgi:hypothetical protein
MQGATRACGHFHLGAERGFWLRASKPPEVFENFNDGDRGSTGFKVEHL